MERRLSPKEASTIIGYSERTLRTWRKVGIGPRWVVEENGRIAYRLDWIHEWEDSIWARSKKRKD